MTPADRRVITLSLNDERGTGGQSKLARLLGWHYVTLWRKLNGKSPITHSDELAIRQAVGGAFRRFLRGLNRLSLKRRRVDAS